MSDWARKFAWATIPAFIVSTLMAYLTGDNVLGLSPSELSEAGVGIFANPSVRVVVGTLVLAIPSYLLTSYSLSVIKKGISRREEIKGKNRPMAKAIKGRPSKIHFVGNLKKFGVDWAGESGRNRGSSEYVYVTGPFCSNCGVEMLLRTDIKWLFFERKVWRCPNCQETVPRPKSLRHDEKEAVEKIFERRILEAREADDYEDYFESRDGINVQTWNPP